MRTIFAEISGFLNSRPLVIQYDDEKGPSSLTPGHFLVGAPIVAPPTTDIEFKNVGHRHRWQMVQELTKSLWIQWSDEYVTQLFKRLNWKNPVENVKVNDVVIVKYENRLKKERDYLRWPMARILKVYPGKDGLVRSVELETIEGAILRRPIHRLCILPLNQELDKIDVELGDSVNGQGQKRKKSMVEVEPQVKKARIIEPSTSDEPELRPS